MTTDARIARQDFLVSAGKTTGIRAELPDGLTDVAWYVGGTLTDVDNLTGATEVEGTADGDETVWTLPAVSVNTPVRMTVAGVPVSVGHLYPSELGAPSPDTSLTIAVGEVSVTLNITGVPGTPGEDGDSALLVAGFLDPVAVDGTASTVTLTGFGTIPTSAAVGLEVLVTGGANLGVYTVTAQPNPWTEGEALRGGDLIATTGPQTLVAVAGSSSFGAVDGVSVAARQTQVSSIATTLDDVIAGVDANAVNQATVDALRSRAEFTAAPTAWLECGPGSDAGYWATPVVLPSPSESMRIRALFRVRSSVDTSDDEIDFLEVYSEAIVTEGAGDDRFEIAAAVDNGGRVSLFFEVLGDGDDEETSYADTGDGSGFSAGNGARLPAGAWVEGEILLADGATTYRVRADLGWDHEDPDDGTRWITTRVHEHGVTAMAPSDGVEQWIGRNGGTFDVARVRRWDDDVLVLDANPSTGTPGSSSFEDSVLEDGSSDPAVWTAAGSNVITTP